ncbi:MAG: hypothetical protein RLW62_24300 [Gammaproteobacteria bacterium]
MAEVRVPLAALAQSLFAVSLIGAGICGLTQPELVPPLARPAVAWSLIGVGVLLDAWAVLAIVGAVRRTRGSAALSSRS